MVNFVVLGPFDVPTISGAHGGRILARKQDVKQAIEQQAGDAKITSAGCYVFSCTASRGSIPLYVGKATRNILAEAFNDRNINNLNHFLLERKRGSIQLFAICQQRVRRLFGNADAIGEIEEFLIGFAARRNRDLLNIHGTGAPSWRIAGVANGTGRSGPSARAFKQLMGMQARPANSRQTVSEPDGDDDIQVNNVESETPNTPDAIAIDEETRAI